MPEYLTLDDVDVSGLDVLVRSDLNVPMEDGVITDDFRIRAALPTLERLVDSGARVSVCSHLGRPEGPDPAFSLRPVADAMAALTSKEVGFESGGQITVLENTRFEPGETEERPGHGCPVWPKGSVSSSRTPSVRCIGPMPPRSEWPSWSGRSPGRSWWTSSRRWSVSWSIPKVPYVVVLGGAKVSDKLGVIENLLPKVDVMLIGGGMCFTILKAKGDEVGTSLVEDDQIEAVKRILDGPHSERLILPVGLGHRRPSSPRTPSTR